MWLSIHEESPLQGQISLRSHGKAMYIPSENDSENRARRTRDISARKELREWLETTVKDAEVEKCALTGRPHIAGLT